MTKTNLKNHVLSFSKGWEQYIEECINQSSGNSIYYISDHEIYRLFFENIVPELQSLVDKRLYLANASIGKSGLAGIPWLAAFDKEITQTTQEQYYISYLFSRNAKKFISPLLSGQHSSPNFMETIIKLQKRFRQQKIIL